MPLVKFLPQPGIFREGTQFSAMGRWWSADKVRFRRNFPEKIGGWQKTQADATFLGTCRNLIAWSLLTAEEYLGVGTNVKYYTYFGGTFTDITPIRLTTNPMANNPFTTGAPGSTTVTVTDTNHGANPGDFVTFSGVVGPIDGIPADEFNGEHEIITTPSTSTYTIEVVTPCVAGGTTGGGASVVAAYQINVGLDTTVPGTGWGAGPWGGSYPDPADDTGWGDAALVTVPGQQLRLWSHDNFGEDLIINVRNGRIYFWDATFPTARAVWLNEITGASSVPLMATEIIVSAEDRHVIALGCNPEGSTVQDLMLVRWSDAEDILQWAAMSTNTAGEVRLGSGSLIVTGVHTKRGTLIWTDISTYSMMFTGPPFTFTIQQVTAGSTIFGPLAKVAVDDVVYWMGYDGFFRYDGRTQPIPCDVRDYVFSDINRNQTYKVHAGSISSFSEVWWFYCSAASDEIDRYVVFNYETGVWYFGTLVRTAWIDRRTSQYPQAAATDGVIYFHEFGADDGETNPNLPIIAYIESGPYEVEGLQSSPAGDQFGFLWRIIPDVTFRSSTATAPTLQMILMPRDTPGGPEGTATNSPVVRGASTVNVEEFTQISYIRLRCRQLTMTIRSVGLGVMWRLGQPRIDVRTDGRR